MSIVPGRKETRFFPLKTNNCSRKGWWNPPNSGGYPGPNHLRDESETESKDLPISSNAKMREWDKYHFPHLGWKENATPGTWWHCHWTELEVCFCFNIIYISYSNPWRALFCIILISNDRSFTHLASLGPLCFAKFGDRVWDALLVGATLGRAWVRLCSLKMKHWIIEIWKRMEKNGKGRSTRLRFFSMVFPWFSHGFPMVFPWFSHNLQNSAPHRCGGADRSWHDGWHAQLDHALPAASGPWRNGGTTTRPHGSNKHMALSDPNYAFYVGNWW